MITPFLEVFRNFRRAEKNTFDIRINAGKEAEELRELEDGVGKEKDEIKDTWLEDTDRKDSTELEKLERQREELERKLETLKRKICMNKELLQFKEQMKLRQESRAPL